MASRPCASHSSSSSVSQPTPWMKPPSIWPRSTSGEIESPTSSRISARSRRYIAGEAVDLHFGNRRAVREVVERLAAAGLRVEVNFGRAVVALREERDALPVGGLARLRRRDRALAAARIRLEATSAASHSSSRRHGASVPQLRQASSTAAPFRSVPAEAAVADVLGTLSVRVGITRIASSGNAEAVGGDLPDLGVQALAHLGAAVVHLHAAIAIDQHQRAGLVEERGRERDAELHRRDGEAALGVRVRRVERVRLASRRASNSLDCLQLLPDASRCAPRPSPAGRSAWCRLRDRSCARARRPAAVPSVRATAVQNVFDHQHALRSAEAAERGLRRLVRRQTSPSTSSAGSR